MARAATPYGGVAETIVVALKYMGWRHLARVCAERISVAIDVAPLDVLVPVPLHSARQRERGFNQAQEIASELAGMVDIGVAAGLERARPTRPQVGLGRQQRRTNVAAAFRIGEPVGPGFTVGLIDDVATSGATLVAAARPLLRAGAARVIGVTFALASDRGHG